jgi:LemA protein
MGETLMILGLAAGVWAVILYNRLVRLRHQVAAAWSDIGVQLKRRHDLIPKLVEAVRAYARYESQTLVELTQLRAASEQARVPAELLAPAGRLQGELRHLVAVAEAYPALKTSDQYLGLQRELSGIEDQIQYARRFYNGAVREYNVRIDSVPDLLVARALGYQPAELFELERADEAGPPALSP